MDCPNEKTLKKRVENLKRGTRGLIEQTGGSFTY